MTHTTQGSKANYPPTTTPIVSPAQETSTETILLESEYSRQTMEPLQTAVRDRTTNESSTGRQLPNLLRSTFQSVFFYYSQINPDNRFQSPCSGSFVPVGFPSVSCPISLHSHFNFAFCSIFHHCDGKYGYQPNAMQAVLPEIMQS
jgi:hypothetical protein